jgi:hypothetical protein
MLLMKQHLQPLLGREVEQRKRIIEVFATADEPGAFQNLQQKRDNMVEWTR